ncbi:hypothetical protein SBF1_7790003 [Candidatus Desulfosporosinus infrequens]|uniref:Uncharacterized protein n=1 Tax=Candidatus Desulfosporosinus infrequens TaxID=2043169 RepID=A0A2U3LRQ2_9FIRM|nr:hypothetical protein SBF1_7790003 [Candidatus Desulfosporosinus infrequens]
MSYKKTAFLIDRGKIFYSATLYLILIGQRKDLYPTPENAFSLKPNSAVNFP